MREFLAFFMKIDINFAGERRVLNSELWHACAGPLVSLPAVGSRVVYFPQGHSEQVNSTIRRMYIFNGYLGFFCSFSLAFKTWFSVEN